MTNGINSDNHLIFLPFFHSRFITQPSMNLLIKNSPTSSPPGFTTPIPKDFTVRGPDKILGIQNHSIARVYPPPSTNDAEPNFFVYIDFTDPDFLWRFTPVSDLLTIDSRKSTPWLALIVLTDDEMRETSADTPPISYINQREILSVRKDLLPPLDESWSFGHVQLSGISSEEFSNNQNFSDSENSSSRLFCFRKLNPLKVYHAFLVPTFKLSLVPHLLADVDHITEPDMRAWDNSSPDIVQLPIYYRWTFQTSEKGDFEELVRRLRPWQPDPGRIGITPLDSSVEIGSSVTTHTFMREGALATTGFSNMEDPMNTRASFFEAFNGTNQYPRLSELLAFLDESSKSNIEDLTTGQILVPEHDDEETEDPLLTFPIYGRYYGYIIGFDMPAHDSDIPENPAWEGADPWLQELNSDLRYRSAASLGTNVVQNAQDEYLRKCWEQTGEIIRVNTMLRLTRSGTQSSRKFFENHINKLNPEHLLFTSTPFHKRVTMEHCSQEKTVKEALKKSGIAPGVLSSTFYRIAYQRIGLEELLNPSSLYPWIEPSDPLGSESPGVIDIVDIEIGGEPGPLADGTGTYSTSDLQVVEEEPEPVRTCFGGGVLPFICPWSSDRETGGPPRTPRGEQTIGTRAETAGVILPGLTNEILEPKAEIIPMCEINVAEDIAPSFHIDSIKDNLHKKLSDVITSNRGPIVPMNFTPIISSPKISDPMYIPLMNLSHDYLIPGVSNIKNNVVFVMEENRRYIEAFMTGINHEMNRELLWNEYPSAQHNTIFAHFWDYASLEQDTLGNLKPPTDINEIVTWSNNLGGNKGSGTTQSDENNPNLVLVLKGDVVRRYPEIIIYAIRSNSTIDPSDSELDLNDFSNYQLIQPLYRGNIGNDILIVGFPFTLQDLQSESFYYFVLQENQDTPVFGLESSPTDPEDPSSSLNWLHPSIETALENSPGGYLNGFNSTIRDLFLGEDGLPNVAPSSASIASKTFQLPVRILYKATTMIQL